MMVKLLGYLDSKYYLILNRSLSKQSKACLFKKRRRKPRKDTQIPKRGLKPRSFAARNYQLPVEAPSLLNRHHDLGLYTMSGLEHLNNVFACLQFPTKFAAKNSFVYILMGAKCSNVLMHGSESGHPKHLEY